MSIPRSPSVADLTSDREIELAAYLSLSPPQEALKSATRRDLVRIATRFYGIWIALLQGRSDLQDGPVDFLCATCTHVHQETGLNLRNRLLMVVGGYYGYASLKLIIESLNEPTLIPSVPGDVERMMPDDRTTPFEWSRPLLATYVTAGFAASSLAVARGGSAQADALIDQLSHILHSTIVELYHFSDGERTAEGDFRRDMYAAFLADRLLGYAVHLLDAVYYRPSRPWSKTHKAGPFSSLRLPELALLASRSEDVVKKYGVRQVEKVFEGQLALLLQSLGFFVTSTRTGEGTVDLVCISSDSTAPFSMLLEAKTTKARYSLPRRDMRAIGDYATEVRANLVATHPLSVVLVVGPEPTQTLAPKMREVQAAAGIPIRYCRAAALANLREALAGPMPMHAFFRTLLEADAVVSEESLVEIAHEVDKRQRATELLVRTFLPSAKSE